MAFVTLSPWRKDRTDMASDVYAALHQLRLVSGTKWQNPPRTVIASLWTRLGIFCRPQPWVMIAFFTVGNRFAAENAAEWYQSTRTSGVWGQ